MSDSQMYRSCYCGATDSDGSGEFQRLMALEEADPAVLKRDVLHLVLHHPDGVKFGDFAGAFLQLHGFHPQLALHGYRSLKDLVTDMKDVVVLEGDSQNPVIKIANDLELDQWLEEGDEYGWDYTGWDDSEEESQSLLYEEAETEEASDVLELITSLLSNYRTGLRIEKLQELLLAQNGVDLEKFSIAHGYQDTLEFLEHQMTELMIRYRENSQKCVVQLTADTEGETQPPVSSSSCNKVLQTGLTVSSSCPVPLQDVPFDSSKTAQNAEQSIDKNRNQNGSEPPLSTNYIVSQVKALLSTYDLGLRLEKVQEFLLAQNGVDLEKFSIAHGYREALQFLKHQIPELTIQYSGKRKKCVVRLTENTAGERQLPVSSSSCEKVLQTGLAVSSSCPVPLQDVPFDSSKTAQNAEQSIDKNRNQNGSEPPLSTNYIVSQVLQTGPTISSSCSPPLQDVPPDSSKTAQNSNPRREQSRIGAEPPPCSSSAVSQLPVQTAMEEGDSADLKRDVLHLVLQNPKGIKFGNFSGAFQQLHGYPPQLSLYGFRSLRDLLSKMKDVVIVDGDSRNPVIKVKVASNLALEGGKENGQHDAEILELLTSLLNTYPHGLRIKKVQEFLLVQNGVDLEKFSIAKGYKDTLEFLEHQLLVLKIKYRENRQNSVVQFTASTAEEIQLPVSSSSCEKLRGRMVLQNGDPGALKRNVLHLVLQHPEGVTFRDFSKAFQQLHGYCPQFISHGYSSLWDLVDDMYDTLVLEGDSQNPLIKVASESNLYQWLEGGEENEWNDSEWKPQSLSYEEGAKEDAGFSVAFVAIRGILKNHLKGLKVRKLKEAIRDKYDIDLERVRSHLGYEDIVSFLQDMPGLHLRNSKRIRNCVVQLQPGPSSPAPSLDTDFSACNSNTTFQEPVRKESGTHSPLPSFDTDLCAHDPNAIPERVMTKKPDSCISMSTQVSAPLSLDSKETATKSETSNQMKVEKKPALEDVLALLSSLLSSKGYKAGLRLKKVQKKLTGKGVNLEKFSIAQGHKDSLAFLECHMPELEIIYHEDQLSCVLKLGSVSRSSTASRFNASPVLNLEGSANHSKNMLGNKPAEEKVVAFVSSLLSSKGFERGLKLKKLQELLMTEGVDLKKFSTAHGHKDSLAFLERHIPELKIRNPKDRINPVLQLKSGRPVSCISTSSQVSAPQSLNSKQSSIKSETLNQMKVKKKPALEEVLSALSSLLKSPKHKSGLRLTKVQEFLLTREGIDLEKFSIAQGHKDSLAFLECHMPQLKIRNQEDRLNCVLQHKSGHEIKAIPPSHDAPAILARPGIPMLRPQQMDTISHGTNAEEVAFLPPLRDAPIPLRKTIRIVKSANILPGFEDVEPLPTSYDYSANRSWIQSLSDPSDTIQNLPISQDPYGAFSGNDISSSQPVSDISDQLTDKCQLHRPPPMEDIPSFSKAQLLRRPNLNGPHHLKDLDELKQEVAHILARHPEGILLFQFRIEYSTAYQKHLQLGNASSAKQFLLQMPDVVCLKGHGVQTLLFPVSSKEPSLKPGHRIISRVEDATVIPSHSLSKAVIVADPVVVFQPSPPRATMKPQPCTVHPLTSGLLGEPGKTEGSILLQSEMQSEPKPRSLLQEHGVAGAKLGNPSGQSHLSNVVEAAMAPGCSLSKTDPVVVPKSSAPKATVAPVPQPHSFPHLYSECLKQPSKKKSPHPNTSPQRATKAANPEEDQVMASARTRRTPLLPSSPVVFPSEWDEMPFGFASKPTHLPIPHASNQSTLTSFLSQPLPASLMQWTQPLVFPPTMFLNQHVSPSYPANVYNTSRPQPQNVKSPSSHLVQSVPQMRPVQPTPPVQPTSPVQSTEQRSYVYAAQGHGFFSQEQTSSRTFIHSPHQAPAFLVDGLPTSLPFQNPPSTYASRSQTIYQTEYYRHPWLDDTQCRSMQPTVSAVDNSITTTSSARTSSQSTTYWNQSVHLNKIVTSRTPPTHLPPTPSNVSQQPHVSRHISTQTLPSSDPGASPQTLSISNRDPQAFKYPQQYDEVRSTTSSIAAQSASSVTSPVYFSTDTSAHSSYMSSNPTTYAVPNQTKSFPATSKAEEQDNHYVTWADKQNPHLTQRPSDSYSSSLQARPPKSPGKCVIL